ncbi:hypothetical protein A6U86_30965 [Rhizobium sp. AC27/96]|uniref:ASCH domain-containing protein n=1 Tax=Rhizobium TaxID=379 RepID=UPI0008288B6E|nr:MULTISPECIES: ASCH domain-containing protein [Rhizobium]OCJ03536.1 hypothetical protein A6U86_30965 [Rhizobium sp. AC27/96]
MTADTDNSSKLDWQSLQRFSFGNSPALADELLDLVLKGKKTGTCWSVRDGQLTEIGQRSVVCDGKGVPRAIIETVSLEQRPFDQVGEAFAHSEGEGDLSLEYWRRAHRSYFEETGGFEPAMMLWCETFRLVAILDQPLAL